MVDSKLLLSTVESNKYCYGIRSGIYVILIENIYIAMEYIAEYITILKAVYT